MRAYLFSRLRLQRRAFTATGLAVALAVAFVVVVLGATATLKKFVEDGAAPRARVASVVAVTDFGDEQSVWPTDAQVTQIGRLPGVEAVSAVRRTNLQLGWPDGLTPTGVESLPGAPGLAWYTVVDGAAPAAPGEVLVDRRSAAELGVRPGDRLAVGAREGYALPKSVLVTGLFRATGPQPTSRTVLAASADVATWGTATDDPDSAPLVAEVDVLGAPGTDPQALVERVRGVVPGLDVRTGQDFVSEQVLQQTRDVDILGRLVLGFTVIALLVSAIVIANTFTILLAQRARELALLRCVGASVRQLRRATRVEAAVLGLGASLAGVAVGVVVLVGGVAVAESAVGLLEGLRPVVGPGSLVPPVLLGLLVTVGAAVLPTRRATRVAPLAALRPDTAAQVRRTGRLRIAAAVLLGLAGGAALVVGLGLSQEIGLLVSAGGGVLLVLAVVLGSPVLVPFVTRLVGAPFARLGPVARIAVGNTRRNATRSAATSTALFVGVCLISVLTVGAATTTRAVDERLDTARPLDVALMTGAEYTDKPTGFPAGLVTTVGAVDGVAGAVGLRGVAVTVGAAGAKAPTTGGDRQVTGLLGADAAALRGVYRGDLPLADDVVLVPDTMVVDGVTDGGRVVLHAGRRSVTVTAHVMPYLESWLVTPAALDRLGAGDATLALWARAAEGADPVAVTRDVDKAVRAAGLSGDGVTGSGGVAVIDYFDQGSLAERASILQAMNIMLLVSTGLLGVALVISLVGIANTLSLSVLERARESAVSRAVGMTRRQLRAGLAMEAALLAVVGCLLGVVVGGGLGWAGAVSLLDGLAGVGGPVVPLGRMGLVVGIALGAAVLASVLPGRRAARVRPTQALAEV
ncbi:FtsX-like permease family protein [Kineosporia sp. R_H_3]|uniref:FtsX-like permease family protein n=1 Tax=Kineosporia sp. R_H_3 TaxID=1961848 RepID=UPI000B4BFA85|nr:ABC transporter permease [Kineosporia sp. R_H_3]